MVVAEGDTPEQVEQAVLAHLRAGGDLLDVALALCRWQQRHVPAYGRFAQGAEPTDLAGIPSVPVALFKHVRFCCTASPAAVFRTSGTTTGARGEHAMPTTRAYDAASLAWFRACVPGCPTDHTISLVTDDRRHPNSSLGHMVTHFAPERRCFFDLEAGVDAAGAWAALAAAARPTWVPTTAFALAELLRTPGDARLPPGSVLMVTGGFKGRTSEVDEAELLREAAARLGGPRLIREYGMTELSSQLWDTGDGYRAPPWLHVYAVDPLGGQPVAGEGLLRFVDLASWGSCLAIETEDLGRVVGDRVELVGRLRGAPARGCSLSVEEAAGWTGV